MSKTIDERIVEMRFDNKQFERNAKTTMNTIEQLKQKLNFKGAAAGLESIGVAAKNISFVGMSSAVETVQTKFSALEIVAMTTLSNITNSAVNAGKNIINALTLEPVTTGFQEYETQINAIQTILANTESKGSTLEDVNSALNELNKYADMTIYNFTEMTRNIGTFTAAGVDLDTSVSSIKGIANLAAVSGSTSQQASTAMYQLSQAMAAGTVKLMDWNSVVNAGMGGQVFQDALKETARVHGIAIDDIIKKQGSFRESLSEGWLTTEILTDTLNKFTGDMTEADLKAEGYTDDQITSIMKMGQTANDAATKVKTITQLFDTLKEAAQSGWTQTWELIVGDFEQAKEVLTQVSDAVSGVLNASSDKRNKLLRGALYSNWDKLVYQINKAGVETTDFESKLKEVLSGHGINTDELTEKYGSLEKAFKAGAVSSDYLREAISKLDKQPTVNVDKFINNITELGGREKLIESFKNIIKTISAIVAPIQEAFNEIFPPTTYKQIQSIIDKFYDFTKTLKISDETAANIKSTFKGLFAVLNLVKRGIVAVISPFALFIKNKLGVSDFGDSMLKTTASIGDFFTALNGSSKTAEFFSTVSNNIYLALQKIQSVVNDKFPIVKSTVSDVFDIIIDKSRNLSSKLKPLSGVFSGIKTVFVNSANDISDSLGPLSTVFDVFTTVLDTVVSVLGTVASGVYDIIKPLISFIAENLSIGNIAAGLAGGGIFMVSKKLTGFLDEIIDAFKSLFNKEESKSLKESFQELMGGVQESLTSLTSGIKVASLLGIAAAMAILSMSIESLSKLNGFDITKSLMAIGAGLSELSGILILLSKKIDSKKTKSLKRTATAMILIAVAVRLVASAMIKLSGLDWEEIGKGLTAMGGALAEMTGSLKVLNGTNVKLTTAVSMLALAESCKMLADGLKDFGSMNWEEIKKGLTAMGGALAEFTASLSILSKIGGFGALLGGGAVTLAVQSLDEISENLKSLGSMNWEEIGKGLAAMGGALAEITAANFLNGLSGLSGLVGAGSLTMATQGLDDLATAFKSFGSMDWDEIKQGLAAMGGALAETALGSLANTLSYFGAISIDTVAEPLGVLADSVKKWANLNIPDDIHTNMANLANAVKEWTYVDGSNIASIKTNIGDFATEISKWNGVRISSTLGDNLTGLANSIDRCNSIRTENIDNVKSAINSLKASVINMQNVDFASAATSISQFASAVSSVNVSTNVFSELGNNIVTKFISALTVGYSKAAQAGSALVTNLAIGIRSNVGSVINSATSVLTYTINQINSYYSMFYYAGVHLVQGFVNGISDNISSAAQAAASMASAASSAANAALDINSPSKVFYGIGGYAGQGFVNALQDYSGKSYSAGEGIATSAREGLQKAISNIANTMNNGVDDLTIRPVVDLSSVQSGVTAMNRLFNGTRSIGITGNLNAISAAVADRQNAASNDDVVMAVNALAGQLTGRSGDSYVINGITYDDGSNITSAVKSLVRAAKMERRV